RRLPVPAPQLHPVPRRFPVPVVAARPDRRRLLRLAAVGMLGIALGVGATRAAHRADGPRPAASVQRLDLPAGGAPAGPGAGSIAGGGGGRHGGPVARPAGPAADSMAGDGRPDTVAPVRAGTARATVRRFLQASADGDLAVAYGLLHPAGATRHPSLARVTRAPP